MFIHWGQRDDFGKTKQKQETKSIWTTGPDTVFRNVWSPSSLYTVHAFPRFSREYSTTIVLWANMSGEKNSQTCFCWEDSKVDCWKCRLQRDTYEGKTCQTLKRVGCRLAVVYWCGWYCCTLWTPYYRLVASSFAYKLIIHPTKWIAVSVFFLCGCVWMWGFKMTALGSVASHLDWQQSDCLILTTVTMRPLRRPLLSGSCSFSVSVSLMEFPPTRTTRTYESAPCLYVITDLNFLALFFLCLLWSFIFLLQDIFLLEHWHVCLFRRTC